jgi:hypothetical protein
MKTIKFYTDTNKYMGWKKLQGYSENHLEVRSWILSGNFCIIADQYVKDISQISKALKG